MFIGIVSIIAAVVLSGVSAFFSVTGIQTIFSGALLGATLMGISLEFSKISATVWLYLWWKKASKLIRGYLTFAVAALILVSSIGIYGYLTKAYVGQEQQVSQNETEIERIDERIARQQENINRAETQLEQLNEAIDRYIELDVITRGLEEREQQREDRARLNEQINEAQSQIDSLRDQKFEIQQEVEQMEVNVGPIRYIAAFLYQTDEPEKYYDNAARFFIILLVLVFDPFAVLMMVAGNISIDHARRGKRKPAQRKKSQTSKKSASKSAPKQKKQKSTQEIPMTERVPEASGEEPRESGVSETPETQTQQGDHQVVVDMSEYVNPEELKALKENSEHRPLRKRSRNDG